MAHRDRKRAAAKRKPRVQRALFALLVGGLLATCVVLDQVVLPRGGSHFEDLGFQHPAVVDLGVAAEAFIHAYLWPLVGAALVVILLAWRGAFDWILKPAIALAAVAVLALAGVTAGTWHANQQLVETVEQASRN